MMEKIVPVGSWDFQMEPTALIKVASSGLRGSDRRAFLVKRAADHVFADLIDKVALYPGDIPIHTIAIGATEGYGCNRNGDGFNEDTCRKQAATFVGRPLKDWTKDAETHNGARFFRHHKNKDPEQSYGYVKAAAYNERMRRVELLLIANGTKEAADRNGGFVIPDSTRQILEANGEMPGSMACKVAYDVCQNCFNKAATRAQYCTSDTCINPHDGFNGLGCRYNLTKLASNGRQQFVENPRALFFDWSEVTRPADRNAFGGMANYLMKAASEGLILGGAALAELYARDNGYGFEFNWSAAPTKLAWQRQLVSNLAGLERELETSPTTQDYTTARAFRPSLQPPVDFSPLGKVGAAKAASGLKALSDRKVLLSLPDFIQVVSGVSGEKIAAYVASVSRHLPGVFNRLAADPSLDQYLQANPFVGEGLPSNEQRKFAAKVAETRGCYLSAVQERLQRSALRGETPVTKLASSELVKTSAADEPGEYLARQFALYKVAFLTNQDSQDPGFPLTSRMVVLQNYI
jgi:hypothetical protein